MSKLTFENSGTTPPAPAVGKTSIFVDNADGHAKQIDENGVVTDLTSDKHGFLSTPYLIDVDNFSGPPDANSIEYNNTDQSLATQLFISDINKNGDDFSSLLDLVSINDVIKIQDQIDPINSQVWRVTGIVDNGAYFTFTVASEFFNGGNIGDKKTVEAEFLLVSAGAIIPSKLLNGLQSGLISGGNITINGGDNTKIDLAAGTGVIVDWTIPTAPVFTNVSWIAQTLVTVINLATDPFTTFYIDSSGVLNQQSSLRTANDRRARIYLDTATHPDLATVTTIATTRLLAYQGIEALLDYVIKLGAINEGNRVSENSTDLTLEKSAGETTLPFINADTDAQNPTQKINASLDPMTWITQFQDGVGGFVTTPGVTVTDPDFFDDGSGTLQAVPNNQFTIKRYFYFSFNNTVFEIYGQTTYSDIETAKASIFSETVVLSSILDPAIFVTALVVQEGATDLQAAVSAGDAEFVDIIGVGNSGSGGPASQDLQSVYNLSVIPQIITSALGAVTLQQGSGSDSDNVLEIRNGAGSQTFSVRGDGNIATSGTVDGRDVAADGTAQDSHIADLTIHRIINDSSTITTELLSASEVDSRITSAVVGVHRNAGGYDASTNTPDLDTSPSGILDGDTYHVTVAGDFFTEAVVPGDFLVANQDDPTTLAHWSRINKNFDDALLPTVDEKDALAGSGTPSSSNKYVTQDTLDAKVVKQLFSFDSNMVMFPTTNPATSGSRNAHGILKFDATTVESVIREDLMSNDYAGGDITLDIFWTSASTSGDVVWGIEFERTNTDIDTDSFDTQQTVISTASGTSGIPKLATITLTNSQADAIVAGEPMRIRLQRVSTSGSDDMAGDAEILRVSGRQS